MHPSTPASNNPQLALRMPVSSGTNQPSSDALVSGINIEDARARLRRAYERFGADVFDDFCRWKEMASWRDASHNWLATAAAPSLEDLLVALFDRSHIIECVPPPQLGGF